MTETERQALFKQITLAAKTLVEGWMAQGPVSLPSFDAADRDKYPHYQDFVTSDYLRLYIRLCAATECRKELPTEQIAKDALIVLKEHCRDATPMLPNLPKVRYFDMESALNKFQVDLAVYSSSDDIVTDEDLPGFFFFPCVEDSPSHDQVRLIDSCNNTTAIDFNQYTKEINSLVEAAAKTSLATFQVAEALPNLRVFLNQPEQRAFLSTTDYLQQLKELLAKMNSPLCFLGETNLFFKASKLLLDSCEGSPPNFDKKLFSTHFTDLISEYQRRTLGSKKQAETGLRSSTEGINDSLRPLPDNANHQLQQTLQTENKAPGPNLTLRIASGFFAVAGIAAIIAAFLVINAATLGTGVLICAGVGVGVTLVSLGFFASTFPTEPANSPALQQ